MLQGFYMTAVMNFISWDKAYAIFPVPTFVHRKMYMLRKSGYNTEQGLLKYDRRGWKLEELSSSKDGAPSHAMQPQRHVGDESTWVIPFDISNVKVEGMEPCERRPDSVSFAISNPSSSQPSWFHISTN